MEATRIQLYSADIPTHWYNVVADLPTPPSPPLGADGKPARPEQMGAIFPGARHPRRRSALPRRLAAGVQFVRAAGIIPAPESCRAIRQAIDEALKCMVTGEPRTILFNLTGHGHFDMSSYERYFSGKLENYDYPADAVAASLAHLPKVG